MNTYVVITCGSGPVTIKADCVSSDQAIHKLNFTSGGDVVASFSEDRIFGWYKESR